MLALMLIAAACGGSEDDGPIGVGEAIERGSDEPQLISGYVIGPRRQYEQRFCEAILESFPPQCGEPSLRLVGVVVAGPEERVTLLGTVDGDVFRLSAP